MSPRADRGPSPGQVPPDPSPGQALCWLSPGKAPGKTMLTLHPCIHLYIHTYRVDFTTFAACGSRSARIRNISRDPNPDLLLRIRIQKMRHKKLSYLNLTSLFINIHTLLTTSCAGQPPSRAPSPSAPRGAKVSSLRGPLLWVSGGAATLPLQVWPATAPAGGTRRQGELPRIGQRPTADPAAD